MTPQLLALFWLGMIVLAYAYARLVRGAWPHGHPWSGLAWLLPAAGLLFGRNPATGRPNIFSGLGLGLGLLCAIIWLFIMPSKSRDSAPVPRQGVGPLSQ